MALCQMARTEEMLDNTYFDENSIIEMTPDDQIAVLLASVGASSDPITQATFDNGIGQLVAELSHQKQSNLLQNPPDIPEQVWICLNSRGRNRR